jgi:hypothetical protein
MPKLFKLPLVILAMAFCTFATAQTKPKTTTKAPVKKAAVKKVPAKKPAADVNAYVCTSNKDKFYHKRSSCAALNKCPETIKFLKTQGELSKYKRKKCTRCFTK